MNILTHAEIQALVSDQLKNWSYTGEALHRDFKFSNFINAFAFMTSVALEAEKMDHHPGWSNVYNKVSIDLNTHKPQGITQLDIELAGKIDRIFKKFETPAQ